MNVLIIEDDPLMSKALSHYLLEAGHTVSSAANGREAIDGIAKKADVDLVICDVMMPVLTGPAFILMLKKYSPHGLPKIIVVSGVKQGEAFLKKIEINYDHFISKPVDFDHLNKVVNEIAATKK